MSDSFAAFRELVAERSGLILGAEKRYLLETRLTPIAQRLQLDNVDALLRLVQDVGNEPLRDECVDALATHESSFFRDTSPFVQLRDVVLPKLHAEKANTRSIRIWSIACAAGQEAYSIAMCIAEHTLSFADWYIDIFATDMVESTLAQARAGTYSSFEVNRGLTTAQQARWFTAHDGEYRIDPALRKHMRFRRHNLLDPMPERGPFDLVFCRNVLIYFDAAHKTDVLARIADVMPPTGLLFLGSAETVIGVSDRFEPASLGRGIFSPTRSDASRRPGIG